MIVRRNGGEISKAKENQEHDRGEHFWAGKHEEYVNVAERAVVIDEEIAVSIVRLISRLGCCKA